MIQGKGLSVIFAVVVVLTTGCGGGRTSSTSVSNTTSPASALTLMSVTPDSAVVDNAVTVQVTGSGFDNSSVIMLDGQSVATTFVNSTTVNTTLAANSATQPTQVNLAVSNASSKLVSNPLRFYWVRPLVINTTALAQAIQGSNYEVTLAATGGTSPYTWSVSSGSLPAGLSLAPATGVISGIPTTNGTFNFTISVSDSSNPVRRQSATTSIVVAAASVPQLAISSSALPAGTASKAYSGTVSATGGTSPYTWSVSSGSLPAGLSLASATGVISGTPTTSGTYNFTASVSDSSNPVQKQSATTSIVVAAASVPQLAISSSVLPAGTASKAYSGTVSATGGTSPYTWSVSSGSLPAGLSLASATGAISGTPTSSGTFNFTVSVSDSSNPVQKQSATTSIVVAASVPQLAISSSALPGGTVSKAYSGTVSATGGTSPYTWSISSGSLPAGLSLASATGVISGTPTNSGTFNFTASVSDSSSPVQKQSATASIVVAAAASPLTITTASLPSGTVNTAYNATLVETGGVAPYTWSVSSGALPTGVSLGGSTGLISGTPSASGTFSVTLSVHDSQGNAAMANFSVTIVAALAITTVGLPSATDGSVYATTLSATGGTPGYTWSIPSGQLPPGLTLAATTGEISGTPTTTGTFSFTTAVSDSGNPPKTQSMASSIAVTAATQAGPKTWYVRPDGGTRYSATVPTGQCNGTANVAYPGSGVNQNCAFNDVRYLWADGTQNGSWAISGGDTVIIANTYPSGQTGWRIGATDSNGDAFNGYSGGNPFNAYNPPIPAGTAGNPTQILGQNYASCGAGQTSQLFGGFGLSVGTLNLKSTQYVNVECLEITDHSNCAIFGSPLLPSACSNSNPYTDYAGNGILTDQNTANILMQDLNVHGFPGRGLQGPIGGAVTMTRVRVAFNGFAGWDFDTGVPNNPNSSISGSYVTMEWNGCNEEYPIVDTYPATYCYSQSTGGFGDSWSGQDSAMASFTCDHCTTRYNTKDGSIGPHTAIGAISYTNSIWYGNMGEDVKWDSGATGTVVFQNNLIVANCNRMSAPITGAPGTFNTYLADYCRADGAAFNIAWPLTGSIDIDHNTIVSASTNVSMDFGCENIITGISVGSSGGTGYQVGDLLYIGGTSANATVSSIGTGGVITGGTLTSGGNSQLETSQLPFNSTYIWGGHGSGAAIRITSLTPATCGGGGATRILRDNIFLGYTDTLAAGWNSSQIGWACYSSCLSKQGTTTDAMWTNRTNNIFYGFNGDYAASYATELTADPLFVGEPSQTWTAESRLDNFNFNITSSSPAKGAGVAISGLTIDHAGSTYATPPSIGALEYVH